ncbi:hypothetical protein U9M48_001844 [Paspalum notatum var. saurae]|uniref:Uncharacterized protein n=1 Tax=Paspalum notatum var. saurae TaxID=547442 RepID=A0AAQ3PK15_PASNO
MSWTPCPSVPTPPSLFTPVCLAAVQPLRLSKAGEPSPIHRAAAREVARHPLVLRLKGCHRGWVKLLLRCFPCICCVGNFLSQGESTSRVIDPEISVIDLSLDRGGGESENRTHFSAQPATSIR